MTSLEIKPGDVKPTVSATAGPEADRWNPWKTLAEKYPHVRLVTDRRLPDRILGVSNPKTIWLCSTLTPIELDCTLAHELTHFELNSWIGPGEPGHVETERVVEEVCARRLIPLRSLAEAMIQRPNAVMKIWAWMLRVDINVLTVRLITLSPVERQALAEIRGGPIPRMPHNNHFDGYLPGDNMTLAQHCAAAEK